MSFLSPLYAFAAGLFAGTFAIYVAGYIIVDDDDYLHALLTASIGGVLWGIAELIGHPFATALVLILWVILINVVYPGGWGAAAVIGLAAWGVTLYLLYVADLFFEVGFDVFGIPGF